MVRRTIAGNSSRSVGLGLFIVRAIAQAHHGNVTVASSIEAGTRFAVTFPASGTATRGGCRAEASARTRPGSPHDVVRMRIQPRHHRAAGRRAQRGRRVGPGKAHTGRGQGIDGRCLHDRRTERSHHVSTVLIGKQEQEVRPGASLAADVLAAALRRDSARRQARQAQGTGGAEKATAPLTPRIHR